MARRDPLAEAPELIRRVYAYVAYRVGDGSDAEDITSEVFERAVRYRGSYDPSKGEPVSWLIGIARRCIEGARMRPLLQPGEEADSRPPHHPEDEVLERLAVASVVERLDERSRELVALRFGADLSARQIGEILGLKTNAVEVALHRTLARLRPELEAARAGEAGPRAGVTPDASERSDPASGWV